MSGSAKRGGATKPVIRSTRRRKGGKAQPVIVVSGDTRLESGASQPIYVVDAAYVAHHGLISGAAQPVQEVTGKAEIGGGAKPVYVVSGSFSGGGGPTPPPPGWTPASPTTSGGISAHTWLESSTSIFEDTGLTIPATDDNDPVKGWTSEGTDGYSVTENTNNPILKTGIINGLPVVRAAGDYLQGAFGNGLISQPNTIIFVGKYNLAGTYVMFDGNDSTNRNALYSQNNDYRMLAPSAVNTFGAVDLNPHIHTTIFNGALSKLYIDGVLINTVNPGTAGIDGLTLFAGYNLIGGQSDIAEFLIYNALLNDSDINEVTAYYSDKYSISYTPI